jgi:alpha-tubulin suppressor-like RCC1 family protein
VMYCWGDNGFGQLGDGTITNRPTPTAVTMPPGITFASVSLGSASACALSTVGTAYCWGGNGAGELGDGTTTDHRTPTAVSMPTGVLFTSISVGNQFVCATTPSTGAYCWGAIPGGSLSLTPTHTLR